MASETDLKFAFPGSGWLLFAGGLAVLALFALTYWAQRGKIRPRLRHVLTALRLLTGLLILFCIAQPFLRRYYRETQRNHVAILVDATRSMTIRDAKDGTDRFGRAKADARALYEQLAGDYETHLYAFGEKAVPVPSLKALDEIEPTAERTNLIGALETVAVDLRAYRLTAVFLLTDGAHNTGGKWDKTFKLFAGGSPIHPIAFGEEHIIDLEITGVRVKRTVSKDTLLNVTVEVRGLGLTGRDVPVILSRKGHGSDPGQVVQQRTVHLGPEQPTGQVDFEFLPEETGYLEYLVKVPPDPEELIAENNTRPFAVTVTKRPLRVLYMEGSEYRREGSELWEHQFLEQTLKEDGIEVTSLLRKEAARAREAGIYWVQHPEKGFPKAKKDLYQYDVIISSDIDIVFFSKTQLRNTVDFVAKHGGGFVMIGGWTAFGPGGYDESIIDDMLPVDMLGRHEKYDENEEFHWEVTEEGYRHPILRLDSDLAVNRKIWEEKQRPFMGHNKVQRAKPAATVLAVHPEDENLYGKNVILAVQQYGRGRSMAFTTDTTAGWGTLFEEEFGELDPDTGQNDRRYYKRFWHNAIRWLAQYRLNAPNKLAYIELETNLFAQGQKTTLRVNALTNEYEPTHEAEVQLTIIPPSGRKQQIALEKDFARPGLYSREITFDEVGRYEFEMSAFLPDGEKLADDRVMVYARKADLEFENFALNKALLLELATKTGGRFFRGKEAERALAELQGTTHIVKRHTDRDIWDMWYILAAILALLALEWFLRKRSGLA